MTTDPAADAAKHAPQVGLASGEVARAARGAPLRRSKYARYAFADAPCRQRCGTSGCH